jgi:Flp pilus assembly secretin CpaC
VREFALALTVAVIAFVGCSPPQVSRTSPPAAAAVTDLGTVAVNDGDSYNCTLSGGRDCRVCLRDLADHRVLVEAVVSRTDAQGNARILARPHTVAKSGEKVSLEIGGGSVALIPEVKLAAN